MPPPPLPLPPPPQKKDKQTNIDNKSFGHDPSARCEPNNSRKRNIALSKHEAPKQRIHAAPPNTVNTWTMPNWQMCKICFLQRRQAPRELC